MIRQTKYFTAILAILLVMGGCKKTSYKMGDLAAPSDIVINTEIVGQDATNPNGDGSGDVNISLTGKNVLSWKIDYNDNDGITLEHLPTGRITRKYTTIGLNTYRITVVAYGPGATSTTLTKEILVKSTFIPSAEVVDNLVGSGSKTWKVNKDLPGHFGVGPWSPSSVTPVWWSAAPNEKVACCNCFYTSTFTFTKDAGGNY